MLGKTVLLDASVLYCAPLRDLLMHVALSELFRAKWSETIHEEWINAILRQRPDLRREQLERTRELMNCAVLDATVQDYDHEMAMIGTLPDPGDVHVVAAAIKAQAEIILTFNLKHFPEDALSTHGLSAVHPDVFLNELLSLAPEPMLATLRAHRASLRNPPKSQAEYLATLQDQRLTRFVEAIHHLGASI